MALDDRWCTEVAPHEGMAVSFRVEERLADERSPWQRLEVVRTSTFGNLMLLDGCTMVSERDEFIYHEMVSHPTLFSHADPRRVVIVGGGDCGTLREVLRHPTVTECWQVEIDERVTRLAERHFPGLTAANGDPRAHLHFGDGLAWIRDAAPGSQDVVIVDSTDPVGPAEGLFGEKFYRDCLKALRPGGFVVQQSESPLLNTQLIVAMHRALRAAGFADVRTLTFPPADLSLGLVVGDAGAQGGADRGLPRARCRGAGGPALLHARDPSRGVRAARVPGKRDREGLKPFAGLVGGGLEVGLHLVGVGTRHPGFLAVGAGGRELARVLEVLVALARGLAGLLPGLGFLGGALLLVDAELVLHRRLLVAQVLLDLEALEPRGVGGRALDAELLDADRVGRRRVAEVDVAVPVGPLEQLGGAGEPGERDDGDEQRATHGQRPLHSFSTSLLTLRRSVASSSIESLRIWPSGPAACR